MAFKGMNPDEGRETASLVKEATTTIGDLANQVGNQINSVEWIGPDYDAYLSEWQSFYSSQVTALMDLYTARADILTQHADEQDDTSNQQ